MLRTPAPLSRALGITNMHSAICFHNFKLAAAYFDKILPIGGYLPSSADVLRSGNEWIPREYLVELTWNIDDSMPMNEHHLLGMLTGIGISLAGFAGFDPREAQISGNFTSVANAYLANVRNKEGISFRERVAYISTELNLNSPAILIPSTDDCSAQVHGGSGDLALILSGAPILDVSAASWDQIVHLRRDKESQTKLQRLRAFLIEKYAGKPISFVEDDLAQRIDAHDRAARKHGFTTCAGVFTTLLDARNLQAAAALGLSAGYLAGLGAGVAATALLEVSNVALEIARRAHALRDWKEGHELAYLIETRTTLPNGEHTRQSSDT